MKHKDAKLRLLSAQLLPGDLDVLLQLAHCVFQRRSRVIHLVNDENALADEALHLAERGQVQPLRACDLGTRRLDHIRGQALVQRQTDSLDGDVGAAGLLEEAPQDPRGDVATATDGDHELRLEGLEDLRRGLLAEFVDLDIWGNG